MDKLENDINLLVSEIKKSSLSKEDALDYLNHVFHSAIRGSASTVVEEYLKKAQAGNFKYSSGFYGNWAKKASE